MTNDALGIAGTGLTLHRKWLDAVADNLANVNTVTSTDDAAFRARYVLATERRLPTPAPHGAGAAWGSAEGRLPYEPDHPLADEDGYVRYPDIDMSEQMGSLILAQRGYQATGAGSARAKTAYDEALQLGT